MPVLTGDPLLATVFGGIVLGVGVGIVIRYGGSLDGTEILAILFNKRTPFSVGETIMFLIYLFWEVPVLYLAGTALCIL